MNDSAPVTLGKLELPMKNPPKDNKPIPMVFDMEELRHVHQLVLSMV